MGGGKSDLAKKRAIIDSVKKGKFVFYNKEAHSF
jgi:hypothetical protein